MECILCNKQYVEKVETSFDIRMNNHLKHVRKQETIMSCKRFQQGTHKVYSLSVKFICIDQLTNTSKSKETLTQQPIDLRYHHFEKIYFTSYSICNLQFQFYFR